MASLTMIYNSLCLPYMLYCCGIWERASAYILKKITSIVTEKMYNNGSQSFLPGTQNHYSHFQIFLFVKSRYGNLILKTFHNLPPFNIQNILKNHMNIRSSRRKNMFSVNYSRTNLRRQCTSSVRIRLWNDLPIDITDMSTIYLFKINIKCSYLQC